MPKLGRIMLVEDDPDIATLASIALGEIGGFEFTHFASGADALAGVASLAPDLVILDFRMPGMNGGEVLAALRARPDTRAIPVAFMTASLMRRHIDELMALGAIHVFRKPFDPLTLADEVQAMWDRHQEAAAGRDGA